VTGTIGGASALRVDARGGVAFLRLMTTAAKSTTTTSGCPANGVWRLGAQAASRQREMGELGHAWGEALPLYRHAAPGVCGARDEGRRRRAVPGTASGGQAQMGLRGLGRWERVGGVRVEPSGSAQ
jgi:hypothetical protein